MPRNRFHGGHRRAPAGTSAPQAPALAAASSSSIGPQPDAAHSYKAPRPLPPEAATASRPSLTEALRPASSSLAHRPGDPPPNNRIQPTPRGYRLLHGGLWSDAGVHQFELMVQETKRKDPAAYEMFVHDRFRQYGVHDTIASALQRMHASLFDNRARNTETFGFFEGIVLYMFHACRDMFSVDDRKELRALVNLSASLFVTYFDVLERGDLLCTSAVPNMNHVWEMLCSLGDYWNDLGDFLTGFPDYIRCLLCRAGLRYKCDFEGSHTKLDAAHCDMIEHLAGETREHILSYLESEIDEQTTEANERQLSAHTDRWAFDFVYQWEIFTNNFELGKDLVTGLPYNLERWSSRQRAKYQMGRGYNRFDEDDYF